MNEIAQLIVVTVKTLFNWLKQFMVDRMKLFTKHWFKDRGRKSRLSKQQRKELYKMIKVSHSPMVSTAVAGIRQ
jgi:transposase